MNAVQARRWLKAAAACDPDASYAGPLALVDDPAHAAAEWQGAVSGGSARTLRLVLAPAGGARGGPRLDAAWDALDGKWLSKATGAPRGKTGPFRASAFEGPVAEALARFHALCPVAAARLDGPRWSLELARPLPWPLFLRCDLSAAFQPRASQLSLLLRDARVAALDFDGEALWARFS